MITKTVTVVPIHVTAYVMDDETYGELYDAKRAALSYLLAQINPKLSWEQINSTSTHLLANDAKLKEILDAD